MAEVEVLTPKINWDRLDVGIEHAGRVITLPGDPGKMPTEKAIEALTRKLKDESQTFNVHEAIDAYVLDAAVAFVKAMTNLYGWASPATVIQKTMFGTRRNPPQMISVKIGHRDEDVVQCPFGAFNIPGVDEMIYTVVDENNKGQQIFIIHAEIKKKDKHLLLELANETRRIVREESIYKGKAIRLAVDDYGSLNFNDPPTFLNVSVKEDLIFDRDIEAMIVDNILVPVMHTDACRKLKVPLKRGVLLEGRYGTGKTLVARDLARICEANNWTFILLDKVQGLRVALEFANRYAPAVVFAEDIDRIMTDRDEAANDLVNVIDGVISKRAEIMTVLTTNFVEKLNPVILRPGRLDAVISLKAPQAGKELSGQIPASIRECVERAKLGMIGRGDKHLSDLDLVTAAKTMKNHLELLNRDLRQPSVAEKLAESLHEVVGNGTGAILEKMAKQVRDIHGNTC
jgi:transitional endoplasmic reticulum ATPase